MTCGCPEVFTDRVTLDWSLKGQRERVWESKPDKANNKCRGPSAHWVLQKRLLAE